jgi:hypothetical protein
MAATKEELESWHRDKAVKDSLVEAWLCVDCGVNTAPGFPDGPTARIEIALYEKSIMRFSCENEVYHVRNRIWREAGMKGWDGCLCIGCLEKTPRGAAYGHVTSPSTTPGRTCLAPTAFSTAEAWHA